MDFASFSNEIIYKPNPQGYNATLFHSLLGAVVDGDFQIDCWIVKPSRNCISRDGNIIQLEPKIMSVLVCLAASSPETVTKEKLLQTVWPDTFVGDNVLTRSIGELRRAFGDDAREPQVIETIAKRGYRLVSPVLPVMDTKGPAEAGEISRAGHNSESTLRGRGLRVEILIGVGAATLVFLVISGFVLRGWWRLRGAARPPKIRSIAVIPLKNLSEDPSQKYIAYGMAEELITDLSQLRALRVVSHTSVLRYENTDKTVPEIARELGVDAVIEGAVQRSADRVRITAQLIYAPKDTNLWARTYDRDLNDVLALQSSVARDIAGEIRVSLTPTETVRLNNPRRVNAEALEAYWKGEYYLSSLRENSYASDKERSVQEKQFHQAASYFEEAIRQDPYYAPAYLGYWETLAFFQDDVDPSPSPVTALAKGRAALMKALVLDDTLPTAHLALGNALFYYDWDWAGAEREYRRGLELNPNSAEGHCHYAEFLTSMGRFDEGLKEQQIQLQLNPDLPCEVFSPLISLESHIERARGYLETHPATDEHYWDLGLLLWKAGRFKEATDVWQEWMTRLGYADVAQAVGRGYARDGYSGALRAWAMAGEAAAKQRNVSCIMMVYVYGVLGDNDRAFAWLEKAYAQHESSLQSLKTFMAWDPIRSDPRFGEMMRRLGLPP